MKWLFGVMLLISLTFFAWMQWEETLTGKNKSRTRPSPLNAEKIRLLAALPPPPIAPPPSPVLAPQAPAPQAKTCPECEKSASPERTRPASALTTLKLAEQLTQRPAENPVKYWVYIPPAPTRAKLNENIATLKKQNVKNYYTVKEPRQWKNAISLGVFKTEQAARKALDGIRAKGIKTAVMGELKNHDRPENGGPE